MSIERTTAAASVSSIQPAQEMRTRQAEQEQQPGTPAAGSESKTQVRLSSLAQQIKTDDTQDVDFERVAAIRAALEAGELPLEPRKIAESLVQEIYHFS
ncbi:flagellar biosynthesis anti-sigma factor FlgM [Cedecea sp.]|jgi:negative regulator of flagellin synthesis FlgM|uniref:flagellar biosynthesis anti-sigma factor FlgM n=1 Tax=Cedecea sp. TaxID=1970739 RepID=UPI002F3EF99F